MIYKDMANADYHALPSISSTAVKTVAKQSVAHWIGAERKETPAMALGSAVHSLALEPHKEEVVRGPETRRGNAWKDAVASVSDNPDAIVLNEADYDRAADIANAARANPVLKQYLDDPASQIEMSVVLTDPDCGIEIRTRPDLYHPPSGTIVDLKSTIDASPRGFQRQAINLGYHIQAFHYCRALQLEGLKVERFVFVAVETSAPYATCAHIVSPELMAIGGLSWEMAMEKIMSYKQDGEISTGWPEMSTLYAPSWMSDEA